MRWRPGSGEGAEAAAELEDLGYGALFLPGGAGGRLLDAVEAGCVATASVPVVTGILNLWSHDPAEVNERFASIDSEHPGRFQLGIGISHAPMIGDRYEKPLAKTRSYLGELPGSRSTAAWSPRSGRRCSSCRATRPPARIPTSSRSSTRASRARSSGPIALSRPS